VRDHVDRVHEAMSAVVHGRREKQLLAACNYS
jgi:hypothetical protein